MSNQDNDKHTSAFRQIMKGTAIFGGTQVITMLSGIVRGKLVAMILGAYGMGISSLLNSAIQPVYQLFSCGLPMASVSSVANAKDDDERVQRSIAFRRCLTVLALLACLFMALTAPLMCRWTLGTDSHILWFVALGFAVLFLMLTAGENALLQSHHALKQLAKCNVLVPVLGLILGVPIYYVLGVEGIVPSMILLSFITWAYSRWCTRGLGIRGVQSWKETMGYGKEIIMLGVTMMAADLLGNLTVYLINTFINGNGGAADVGFYQSANTITMQCTAMVFTALVADYYPRLSQVSGDLNAMRRLVSQEGEILVLIAAPISALLIVCSPVVIRILLTSEFDCVVPVMQMMSLTFLMRAYYRPLDYICLAKSDKMYYFYLEGVFANVKMLALFIAGYKMYGLIGLGYASVASEALDVIVSTVLVKWRYDVLYSSKMLLMSAILFVLTSATLLSLVLIDDYLVGIVVSVLLVIIISAYSLVQLNKRISIIDAIKCKFNRK